MRDSYCLEITEYSQHFFVDECVITLRPAHYADIIVLTWKNTFIFSVKFDPRYPIVESVGIGSGSVLVPEMQQATTWISDNRYPDTIGPFY